MKKHYLVIILTGFIVGWHIASGAEVNPFLELKRETDAFDASLTGRNINKHDVQKWCALTEKFIFHLFNQVPDNQKPLEHLENAHLILPNDMILAFNKNEAATIYYKTCCGSECRPNELVIKIVTLDLEKDIYYLTYGKSWWDFPECQGDQVEIDKSFIMERNRKSGHFEITARFEESNFYRDWVLTGKLGKMVGIEGNPYGSEGAIETKYDPIQRFEGGIRFNTKLTNCKPGGPSCHKMYLYWVYDKNKKLRCLYFIDDYTIEKDPETGQGRPVGKKIELSP